MKDIFAGIERKNRAILLASALLVIYNTLRLLSIIAAPYQVDQIANIHVEKSISEYQVVFQNYINEESEKLQMPSGSLKIIILYSGGLAVGYIIFSLFLGMRKKIAKDIVLSLVLVETLVDFVVGIKYSILPSKISIILGIFMLLFLFSTNIGKAFKQDK